VPLRKGLRIEDVGRSVAEHAGRNTDWPVPKALVFTPSADLEIGTGSTAGPRAEPRPRSPRRSTSSCPPSACTRRSMRSIWR
jgi:hypothetical protein